MRMVWFVLKYALALSWGMTCVAAALICVATIVGVPVAFVFLFLAGYPMYRMIMKDMERYWEKQAGERALIGPRRRGDPEVDVWNYPFGRPDDPSSN